MAIVFGKPKVAKSARLALANVFEADVTVLDETDADSGAAGNALRVVTNFRGFTRDKAGRKSPLIHQTVVDLSAIGQPIPLSELRATIAALSKVADDLEAEGILGGKGNPLLD